MTHDLKFFIIILWEKIKKKSINLPALQNDVFFYKLIKLILEYYTWNMKYMLFYTFNSKLLI